MGGILQLMPKPRKVILDCQNLGVPNPPGGYSVSKHPSSEGVAGARVQWEKGASSMENEIIRQVLRGPTIQEPPVEIDNRRVQSCLVRTFVRAVARARRCRLFNVGWIVIGHEEIHKDQAEEDEAKDALQGHKVILSTKPSRCKARSRRQRTPER